MMKTPYGIGAGRRKTLQAIGRKERLDPIEEPDNILDVIEAVETISVSGVLSPPKKTIDEIESIHEELPSDAKPYYVRDELLLQRVNAARNQFNDWMGKRQRMAEIPSPMEAGSAKYPVNKARKRRRWEDEARTLLEEKVDRITAAARGSRQRALNAIGLSVAEYNNVQRDQQRDEMQYRLAEGSIVKFRNPSLQIGRVIRVNKKSVRVKYPNPQAGASCPVTGEDQPEETEDRVQLDSEYLEHLEVDSIEAGKELIDGL